MQLGFRVSRESIWHCGANCCQGTLFRVASLSSTQCLFHFTSYSTHTTTGLPYRTFLIVDLTNTNKRLYLSSQKKKPNSRIHFIQSQDKTTQTHLTKLLQTTINNGQSSCTLQQHGRRCPLP